MERMRRDEFDPFGREPPFKRSVRRARRNCTAHQERSMKKLPLVLLGSTLALTTVAAVFGGWAVVTVENPPEYLVAGKPVDIDFTVRQHGFTLRSDLKPGIEATSGSRRVIGSAWAIAREGGYRATITVPQPGEWRITINSGWGSSTGMLLPLRAIESSAHRPEPLE